MQYESGWLASIPNCWLFYLSGCLQYFSNLFALWGTNEFPVAICMNL